MPASMDGLHFDYEFAGTPVTFVYHVTGNSVSRIVMNGAELAAERMANPYRKGGLRVSRQHFEEMIQEHNRVEIFM